ncbi:MFS general substrate transporter [Flagelloscypha sp. PMI_526]|nr:MFS general substrate transporter [Flagelloscypha sp. PMI_526]
MLLNSDASGSGSLSPTSTLKPVESQDSHVKYESDTSIVALKPEEITYPDGGLAAWLIVVGGVICNIVAFGYVTSYGVFQSYYEQFVLQDETPSNISWIGSIQAFMLLFPGLFGGVLFDKGWFRLPLLAASAALVTCTFLVGQCTKYWQFLLCQGIASGFAGGMLFSPVMSVIGDWWCKRRGFAFGLVTMGSSIGGVVIPILVRRLIPRVGFPWTMRILGFLFLGLLTIPNLTLRRRLPAHPRKGIQAIWDPKMFAASPEYSVYIVGSFIAFLGVYGVIVFLDISAVSYGIDKDFSFYLIAIMNGASSVGRISAGLLGDRFGPGNAVIFSLLFAAAVTYGWPLGTSQAHFIASAVFYGIASGGFVATFMIPLCVFGHMKDLGKRVGMANSLMSLAALGGSPINGALIGRYGFKAAGYFSGSGLLLGASILVPVRYMYLKGRWIGRF